ncbi:type IA DNA topoisomerase [Clostridium sp. BJN0001]|uniref:type IA DNA topoisomerase n=1 Tax=Clostridium sp. BJN0001 TaxID=2930219 RepID=UPI001FD4C2E2|nr:type IA DNA topoisomerase [Clostridium sp. BJN0001]
MSKVIIAEKPSVAKNIADALNIKKRKDGYFESDKYYITWAFGHLLQLYDAKDYNEDMKAWRFEKFPFIPEKFKYKVKSDNVSKDVADKGATKQLSIIKSLIDRDDVSSVVSATDFDREGQVIADEILGYFKVKKPVYRLLLNEWTQDEVKNGMENLKDNKEMKNLQDAGIGRQLTDWIIGINLTSVSTLKYKFEKSKTINIGRVLLPTLKIIYDRDKEIENFVSSDYYKLLCIFIDKNDQKIEALYYENDNEKFEKRQDLKNIAEIINGTKGIIIDKKTEEKLEYPPRLFNLSNLQGYITSKYKGWTSDKVLKVAQSLYEKKYTTYPRTSSFVLDESLKDRVKKVFNILKKGFAYENELKFSESKRIFDSSKVESHSAITPTYMKPSNLTADEKIVYEAIRNRFFMQFMLAAKSEETKITIKDQKEDIKGVFIAKGKVKIEDGWKKIENIKSKDVILPQVNKGDILNEESLKISKVTKKPPKHHTEKTLLRVMETCGKGAEEKEDSNDMMESILSGFSIGTPATRAETIKKLKDIGYIKYKGKSLIATELGKNIVETFPVKELFDLDYTGKLEKTLSDIEKGKFKKNEFLHFIIDFTKSSVELIKNDMSAVDRFKVEAPSDAQVLGKCPICGNPVIEYEKSFGCTNWKNGCKFTIWKNDKYILSFGKKVSKEMIILLLKNGKVGFRNLKSRKGNTFSAYFRYVYDKEILRFKWEMEFL